jgi:hypothetical protein
MNANIYWYFYQIKLQGNMLQLRPGHLQAISLYKNKTQLYINYVYIDLDVNPLIIPYKILKLLKYVTSECKIN